MMYRILRVDLNILFFAFALLALAAAAKASDVITIVANPGRFGTVEAAASAEAQVNWWDDDFNDDNACTESFAAVELRHFLAVCLGMRESEIRLAGTEEMPEKGDVFLIGSRAANPLIASFQLDADKSIAHDTAESFHVAAFSQGNRTITIIKGGDRVGALYGVYAYLEQLGIRFYGLGDRDTVVPVRPVALPARLDLSEKPDYLTRGFYAWEDRGDPTFFLWMARNRMNLWCAISKEHIGFLKKLGMKLIAGEHVVQARCLNPHAEYPYKQAKYADDGNKPPDPYPVSPQHAGDANGKLTYFETHPEWYGLRNGKRSDNITAAGFGDNYCTSNRDATAELAKNIVQQCIDGEWRFADMLNVWMLDNGRWCECDACRRQGSCTDRLLGVTYAVRKALQAARAEGRLKRNVQVVTLAYHETLPAPSEPLPADFDYANCLVTFFPIERCYVHALADPACTEVNELLRRNLEGWTTGSDRFYTGSVFIGEYYNVSSFKSLPVIFTRVMAADIPWYYQTGARHFHYMHVPTRLWGTWRLNHYLMARLLWSVKANSDRILDEYFAGVYPTTSARMRTFYRELEYATANFKAFKHYIYVNGEKRVLRHNLADDKSALFPCEHLHYEAHHPVLNDGPDVVEIVDATGRARRAIDDALMECADATERLRIMEDERRFAYGEATIEFYYRLVRTAMFHRKGDVEQARREFALVERQAAILEAIVDLVQVSSSHANAENGLDASQVRGAYERFKKILNPKR
jgi:hypothetical protein